MKHFVTAALAVILCINILPRSQGSNRYPRRTGDQAPNGKCMTLRWGGSSGASGLYLHHYVCCNNCYDKYDKSCDGTTYQSASSRKYCDSCGVDNSQGNARTTGRAFKCGGCYHQRQIQTKCTSGVRKFFHIPGLCWAFANCFKKKCKEQIRQRRSSDSCFDLVCNNGETTKSCPSDCCGTVNEKCDWRKYNSTGDCAPVCCGESTCCNVNAGMTAESSPLLWIITLLACVGHIFC